MAASLLITFLVLSANCRDRQAPGASSAPMIEALEPGTHERVLEHDGRERSYLVHLPKRLREGPLAAVIVYHGGGGRAASAIRMTGFDRAAEEHGFLAVFPNGSGRLADALLTWNAGNCCGYAREQGIDDVGFTSALIAALRADYDVSADQIYVTGMSNGGMMAYRLACERADLIAGAAPVAGALSVVCAPSEAISLIAFHGTNDQSVLYAGGPPKRRVDPAPRVDASVATSVGVFVDHNGCEATPRERRDGEIVVAEWGGCANGTAVVLQTIEGGGHAWPGGVRGTLFGDAPTQAISATDLMWAFFAEHPKR